MKRNSKMGMNQKMNQCEAIVVGFSPRKLETGQDSQESKG
jgi:hypothetical protein